MAWVRVDDRLHAHPKVLRAWQADPRSIGLHLLALSYAGDYLTDGAIDESFVHYKIPTPRQRARAIAALVDAGLWEPNGTGWQIHDFLDYNASAATIKAKHDWDNSRKSLERDRELVAAIRARDHDRCRYCGIEVDWNKRKGPTGANLDHVRPRGPNTLENIVTCCRRCNGYKGGRTPEEAGMTLLDASMF